MVVKNLSQCREFKLGEGEILISLLKNEKVNLHDVDPVTSASLLHLIALVNTADARIKDIIDLLIKRGLGYNFTIPDAFGSTPAMIADLARASTTWGYLQEGEAEELYNRNMIKTMIEFFETGIFIKELSTDRQSNTPLLQAENLSDAKETTKAQNSPKTLAEKRAESLTLMTIKKGECALFRNLYQFFSSYITNSFHVNPTSSNIRLIGGPPPKKEILRPS